MAQWQLVQRAADVRPCRGAVRGCGRAVAVFHRPRVGPRVVKNPPGPTSHRPKIAPPPGPFPGQTG
eukprot:14487412-Alexandrium_andersonii.AAC.1